MYILGQKKTQQEFSFVISKIYQEVFTLGSSTNENISPVLLSIFEKPFIIVLYTCFGLNFFLNNFFQLFINCIVVKNNLSGNLLLHLLTFYDKVFN